MTSNIIVNSLAYHDRNTDKYKYMFDDVKYISFEKNEKKKGDMVRNNIYFYDKDRKKIHTSRYEVIGIYENLTKSWVWGWANPKFDKNTTYISRQILNYGLDIEDNSFLKAELITSRFRISNSVQLDIHSAIASYISKNPIVYRYIYRPDNPVQLDSSGEHSIAEITSEFDDDKGEYTSYYLFILDEKKTEVESNKK